MAARRKGSSCQYGRTPRFGGTVQCALWSGLIPRAEAVRADMCYLKKIHSTYYVYEMGRASLVKGHLSMERMCAAPCTADSTTPTPSRRPEAPRSASLVAPRVRDGRRMRSCVCALRLSVASAGPGRGLPVGHEPVGHQRLPCDGAGLVVLEPLLDHSPAEAVPLRRHHRVLQPVLAQRAAVRVGRIRVGVQVPDLPQDGRAAGAEAKPIRTRQVLVLRALAERRDGGQQLPFREVLAADAVHRGQPGAVEDPCGHPFWRDAGHGRDGMIAHGDHEPFLLHCGRYF
eukprot:scaffold25162_cov122-Isochrysis_galbana.AAC.2